MVKATPIDMALSDIISSKKKRNTDKRGVKRPIKKAAAAGVVKKRRTSGGVVSKARQSGGSGRRSSGGGASVVRKSIGAGANNKRMVRINISNLARTVLSSDLQELFHEFQLRKVSVNFNEDGTPVGTGDLVLSKFNADRLIQQFAGVALDGKTMNFAVIDTYVPRQPEVPRRSTIRRSSGATSGNNRSTKSPAKSARPPAKKITKKPKREPKAHKTAAELDAELDEYMARA